MKFLIADDATVMRRIISRALVEMNAAPENIDEVATGREAVDLAQANTYALIFMDWNMPVMLGIDAIIELRALGNTTPILMVTTEGEKANVLRAIQAGANNYLVKPFTVDDFKQKVHQLIGDIPALVNVGAPQSATEAAVETVKVQRVDLETGRIIQE